jgi:hypothetical protein
MLEDGIVCATALPGAVQTLADAQENARAEEQLAGGKRHALFIDMRQIRAQDREAREFYSKPENTTTQSAVAILIGSPISKVIGIFLSALINPPFPPVFSPPKPRRWRGCASFVRRTARNRCVLPGTTEVRQY